MTIGTVDVRVCECGVYVAPSHPHVCTAPAVPAQRSVELADATPAGRAFGGDRCEAYPTPFARCNHAALWTIELDVTGADDKVRERWEYVAACRTHKDSALAMVLARLASNRAGVLRITPTDRNGETL